MKTSLMRPDILRDAPAVGIMPAIDSRLRDAENIGILMAMAKALAEFITNHVRLPNGKPVRVVIAEPVGGRAELAECQALFRRENVGLVITVSPFWCYSAEVVYPDRTMPQAIWGFNGTERPGAVFLAAAVSHCLDQGIRVFPIYGRDVQPVTAISIIPEDVQRKILQFVYVGLAVAIMKGKNYLSIGACSMGIDGSIPAPRTFRNYFGMGFQFCDMSEVSGRMRAGVFDGQELENATTWRNRCCRMGFDPNASGSPHNLDTIWEQSLQMTMIFQDMMCGNPRLHELGFHEKAKGYNAILAGFQGQRNWTDFYPNGDPPEALCNSSFDWQGVRMPKIVATENDALNGLCMLLGFLLTHSAQVFADLRTFWSPEAVAQTANGYRLEGAARNGILHCLNSGPAALDGTGWQSDASGKPTIKPWYEVTEADVAACLGATTWHPADNVYFPGGGLSTRFATRGGMPVTMTRLVREEDGQLVLHIMHGETVDLPRAVHDTLDKRTNPTWPTTWVAVYGDTYGTMNAWGANHCVVSAGHIGQLLRSTAAQLGIAIGISNIDPNEAFLPAQWAIYGDRALTNDTQIARRLGPLHA